MSFTNVVNAYRRRNFDIRKEFDKIVIAESTIGSRILEVGCNLRPINKKSNSYVLDGLDPDARIDLELSKDFFNNFYKVGIEDFYSQEKYDVIVLNMVFEHLQDNNFTMEKLKSLLKKNGKILICAPSNLHPFSIINQILPHNLKLKVLSTFLPWKKDVGDTIGWRSYYDKCNIYSLMKLMQSKNLVISKSIFSFNASEYFSFFPPLFLLIVLYEEIMEFLKFNLLCATFIIEVKNIES